ncbi:hypothetical protein QR685DRAFT_524557 [Neurospora intermedia]|uniref:Uncharacterized protein n=1 Tax=Neurospora intermedia TaxID=5142 RepID=A0ABR3DFV7_NEUIN
MISLGDAVVDGHSSEMNVRSPAHTFMHGFLLAPFWSVVAAVNWNRPRTKLGVLGLGICMLIMVSASDGHNGR